MAQNSAKLTAEQAADLTASLYNLITEDGENLMFNFLNTSKENLTAALGTIFIPATISASGACLLTVLETYVDRMPRQLTQAVQARIATTLNPPLDPPDQNHIDSKIEKICDAVKSTAVPDSHFNAFKTYIKGLLLVVEYATRKLNMATTQVALFDKMQSSVLELHENVVTSALLETPRSELVSQAKDLMKMKSEFVENMNVFGAEGPPADSQPFTQALAFEKSAFSWTNLVTAVRDKSLPAVCQVFTNFKSIINTVEEFKPLFKEILDEVGSINQIPIPAARSNVDAARNEYITKAAEDLLNKTSLDGDEPLEEMDTVSREDVIEQVADLLKDVKLMEKQGQTVSVRGVTLANLTKLKLQAQRLNKRSDEESKKKIKDAEFQRTEQARGVPVAKLPPLTDIRSWLPFLSAYKELTASAVSEQKKLTLILSALNPVDKAECSNQPLQAVQSYLMSKYNDVSLIVQTLMQDALNLPKPRNDADMERNILSILKTFEICQHHGIISHFDSTFTDQILVLIFTERELSDFLKEKQKAKQRAGMSSTRVPFSDRQSNVDLLHESSIEGDLGAETAEEKRTYLIEYLQSKLTSLRAIASQKRLLNQRSGVASDPRPKKAWEKKIHDEEVKKGEEVNLGVRSSTKYKKKPAGPASPRPAPPPKPATSAPPRASPSSGSTGKANGSWADREKEFRCSLGCLMTHQNRNGKLNPSLVFCPKFLSASPEEQDSIVKKVPNICRVCVAPRSSHRGHQTVCWMTKGCRFCRSTSHNSILCRVKTADEKRAIDAAATESKKITIVAKATRDIEMPDLLTQKHAEPGVRTEECKKLISTVTPIEEFVASDRMTPGHEQFGFNLYEGDSTQGATGDVTLEGGKSLKAQCDNGAQSSFVLEEVAQKLRLPVTSSQTSRIKTLSGAKDMTTRTYKIKLIDNKNNIRVLKVIGLPSLGGNPVLSRKIREKLAEFWKIPAHHLASMEGSIQILIGQKDMALAAKPVTVFSPPANSPNILVGQSDIISGYFFFGGIGLDESTYREEHLSCSARHQVCSVTGAQGENVKNAIFEKFIEAEQSIKIDAARCSACAKCEKCKYQNSQISIREEQEMCDIQRNIEIVKHPDVPGTFYFRVQYVMDPSIDLYQQFARKDSNFNQVRRSTLAFRAKLEKLGRLDEFHELIQAELRAGYMTPISEQDDIAMCTLPESYNRISMVFKESSPTSAIRLTNDASTGHKLGLSANDVQAKGRTSLCAVNRVLWHFMEFEIGWLNDMTKCYRNCRTKLLSNTLRRILWFQDPRKEETLMPYMPVRMSYGDRQPDKIISVICRNILAPEAEKQFGEIGVKVSKILHRHMYLDDTASSFRDVQQKNSVQDVYKKLFSKYSLPIKNYVTTHKYGDHDQIERVERLKAEGKPLTEQILGIVWNFEQDSFVPVLKLNVHKRVRNRYVGPDLDQTDINQLVLTKRVMARVIAECYDATGRCLPIAIIAGKTLYSKVCKLGPDWPWDQELPPEHSKAGKEYLHEMVALMRGLKPFPRAFIKAKTILKSLVGLRDGGQSGYGVVIYAVSADPSGQRSSRIVGSKQHVSEATMHCNEAVSQAKLMALMCAMFEELESLQECEGVTCIAAGDSEAVSFGYNPQRIEKNVLVRNSAIAALRDSKRIISYNPTAQIHYACIPGERNSSDLVSKAHTNICEKTNSDFFRHGHPDYLDPQFGIGVGKHHREFYRLNGKEEVYTSLRTTIEEEEVLKEETVPGEPPTAPAATADEERFSVLLSELVDRFENIDSLVKAVVNAEKIRLRKSFKINETPSTRGFSWNPNLLKRTIWRRILRCHQAKFTPTRVAQMQPTVLSGLLVSRNRLSQQRHLKYFGLPSLPIVSPRDRPLVRLLLANAHTTKSPQQPSKQSTYPAGTIHLSKYLTRIRMKTKFYGVHIADLRSLVRTYVDRCTVCRKEKAEGGQAIEGDKFVVENWEKSMGLFAIAQIDLIGSFTWSPSYNLRNKITSKMWLLVIVCSLTGAIAFQCLESYSTNSFILGLKTFIQRFRSPQILTSDPGTQLKKAAKLNQTPEETEGDLDLASAMKNFPSTQFIVCPRESQFYTGKVESQIKQAKRLLRSFFSRIKKQSIPTVQIFAFQHLLATVANTLNDRPIFHNSEFQISPNDLIKPFQGTMDPDFVKMDEVNNKRYAEFCSIFEEQIAIGSELKTNKTVATAPPKLEPDDFVLVKFPSRIGFYKYARVLFQTPNSTHRYTCKIIGRRTKGGLGKPTVENIPIQNLVLLHRPGENEMDLPEAVPLSAGPAEQAVAAAVEAAPAAAAVEATLAAPQQGTRNASYTRRLQRRAALQGKTPGKLLTTVKTTFHEACIENRDLASLAPSEKGGKLVNDSVLDTYGKLVQDKYPDTCYITTYFMQMLAHNPAQAAREVAKKCPTFFTKEVVLFPIHTGSASTGHWCLLAADLMNKRMFQYDSMNADCTAIGRKINRFLFHLSRNLSQGTVDMSEFKILECPSPKQSNGTDCGAFTLAFLEAAAQKHEAVIKQEQIPAWRLEVMRRCQRGYI